MTAPSPLLEAMLQAAYAAGDGLKRDFAAIAEQWEMVDASTDGFIARGDRIVWVGRAAWRNLKTLRVVSGPKVDVWTVRDGLAVHFLEMFDSYGCARALGMVDPPEEL